MCKHPLTLGVLLAAAQTISVAIFAVICSAEPTEPPPVFVSSWRASQDRAPRDLFAVPPNKVYVVDANSGGEIRDVLTGTQLLLGGFLAVEPVSNDAEDLTDVAVAPDGRIFTLGDRRCCGTGPDRLWRFTPIGTRIGYGPVGSAAWLEAVAVPDNTTLLVAADDGFGTLTLFACNLDGSDCGPLLNAAIPRGTKVDMAIAPNGDVYLADGLGNRILRYSQSGALLDSWGSLGTGEGQFDWPSGVAVDDAGDVYVSDLNNNRVQKFSPDGTFKVAWGGFFDSHPGTGPELYRPQAVACMGDLVVVGTAIPVEFGNVGQGVKVFQSFSATPTVRKTWGGVKALYRP